MLVNRADWFGTLDDIAEDVPFLTSKNVELPVFWLSSYSSQR